MSLSSRFTRIPVGLWLAAALWFLSPGCRVVTTTAPERSLEARGEDLLACNDPEGALTAFQQMAAMSTNSTDRARANLGLARAHLKLRNYRLALDCLYSARKLCDLGPLHVMTEKLLGEAAFLNQDFGLARGYLERSLPGAAGEERNRILVQLHICAMRSLDSQGAARYFAEVKGPLSLGLKELMREHLEAPPLPPAAIARPPAATRPPAIVRRPPSGNGWQEPMRVLSRRSWDARPVRANVDQMGNINCVTIHHTGGPTFWGRSEEEAADEIRKIQKVHQNQNRWADIGYHYIIDRMGRVWQGRPLKYQGAHAHGTANRGNVGVVMLGNYLQQEITEGQMRSLRKLVLQICGTYHIPSTQIFTHSEIRDGYTDCPGPAISRAVDDIRRSL